MIAFISDIHGNYPALQAVLHKIDELNCTEIICLGDVVGYYCQINECIDLLRRREIPCLLGNHDYYMISGTCCNSKTVKICLDHQRKYITSENLEWLRENQPALETPLFSARHGGWNDAVEERFQKFDFSWVESHPQKLFVSGHTHIQQLCHSADGMSLYCNPGAVGQPRDGDPNAAFAVFDETAKQMTLHRVEYDIDAIVGQMKRHEMGEWIWKVLYTGKQIGTA